MCVSHQSLASEIDWKHLVCAAYKTVSNASFSVVLLSK